MSQKSKQSRREFLKGAVAASGAAAVVVSTGSTAAITSEKVVEANSVKKEKGYRETQHVQDYYNSARS